MPPKVAPKKVEITKSLTPIVIQKVKKFVKDLPRPIKLPNPQEINLKKAPVSNLINTNSDSSKLKTLI